MSQKHGCVTFFDPESNEQQHKTDGCYDLRVHHREIIDLFHQIPNDFF